MRTLWILLGALLVGGCQASGQTWGRSDPDAGPWALGFVTPYEMGGWVEDSATVDVDGNLYRRIGSSASGGGKNGTDGARGWAVKGAGNEREVRDAKLPVRIYIRWQSVVEPQTYQGWIEIPESARQLMRNALSMDCPSIPEMTAIPKRASVLFGLAPGGVVQVWVMDECLHPVKVAHVQVEIEPKGPALGLSGGRYYPQTEASKQYVEKHGIPYGSW
ncbi:MULTISPECIES: DUF2931 family protein [unclassified Pseudomonas]|uniref:DUF2931 family protein n=1 Tax=unclassified Pseudomonas TaxID=196821 RepID=UPI002AC96319|nr:MULTISPECIES: DUF2931 family protein [unclassified Pseudomonas]MEB0044685.1 DUF2931 family protein [Pseudomonas sp. Dout3]MEB0096348.1 DUF2931 family protein [Pseudomonas sp. DC1.2]WPX59255.1 DUF2931 family protein [Pseudomonas sp. DC1.2]